ncbi:MAG TPA: T9SS type A sorting domain-containing protein [Flavobacteriaceae bacterium]|nr:T9SS type A sorting domain-containing protein [Flavobacteriaceae bacterium]
MTDSDGTQLFYSNGDYGSGASREFGSNGILGIDPAEFQNEISVYPNPTHDNLFIANAENASIEIFNVLGKRIVVQSDIASNEQINVSNLQTGTYFIRITSENKVETMKFVVTK